jgi:hypothetical protein
MAGAEGSIQHEQEAQAKPPEVSLEGVETVIGRLAHLSHAVDEHKLTAASPRHPDITYGAQLDAERGQAQLDVAVQVLDLVVPRVEGSWAEEVESFKADPSKLGSWVMEDGELTYIEPDSSKTVQ